MKNILKFVFVFAICFLFNSTNVYATESTGTDTITPGTDLSKDDEFTMWDRRYEANFFAPVQNNFFYSSGSLLSYSGSNPMIAYKTDVLSDWYVYTSGNQIYQSYNNYINAYAVDEGMYFFSDDNQLFLNTRELDIGYTPSCELGNVIESNSYITAAEASQFCLGYKNELLEDKSFLEKNKLTSTYHYNSWSTDGYFNPYVEGISLKDSETYITIREDGVDIPLDVDGVYFDYLYANSGYTNFTWWRAYFNGVHGSFTWDEIENRLYHSSSSYDSILIIGIGTYDFAENEEYSNGVTQAPNLANNHVVAWNYCRLSYSKYNLPSVFNNSTCMENYYEGTYNITASTSGKDVDDNTSDDKPNGGGDGNGGNGFNIGDYVFNNGITDGLNYINNYFTSIGTSITAFNAMMITVLAWIPSPILNLLSVSLMTFVVILFIKLILHLL